MTQEAWRKVTELFQAALGLEAHQHQAFLDRECAGDIGLRDEVLQMLNHHEQAERDGFGSFLSRGFRPETARTLATIRPARGKGRRTSPRYVKVSLGSSFSPQPPIAIESLLFERMPIVPLILLISFTVFFLFDLSAAFVDLSTGFGEGLIGRLIFWSHLSVIVSCFISILLWYSWSSWTELALSMMVLALGAIVTIFFVLYTIKVFSMSYWTPLLADGYESRVFDWTADSCGLRWFCFLVFYGLFMPTTWANCLRVLGCIALCPVATVVVLGSWEGTLWRMGGALFELTAWLGLGTAMAAYGSYKITEWRHEAAAARKLGDYELKGWLGSGGMGEVYLAEHSLLPRPCAIKLIRPEKSGDQASLVRFERKAQETAKLENPNTIRIFDCGRSDEGSLYLVMEYLRGLTFQQLVDRYGPLPPERVAYFLLRVCASLREAHEQGLIHRDVKPSNIMACNLGGTADVVKLLDFGLVQTTTPGEEQVHPAARHYLAGTPAYLSPEQASGHGKPDARSDIYSLGAVGYFLLTGEPPFVRDSPVELIVAHREDAVPPISNPRREVPADLESIILRCLEKEPARRFLDVAGLEGAVSECACAGRWTKTDRERWWLEHPMPDDSSPWPIAATPTPN